MMIKEFKKYTSKEISDIHMYVLRIYTRWATKYNFDQVPR